MIIINLISGPRNISTALMYSFAQRSDTRVWDEPFYAIYLSRSGVMHPGHEDVLKSQPISEIEVLKKIENEHAPVQFIKNMAHHVEVLDQPLINQAKHVFLIRNPKQIIASYAEVIEKPVMRDIGIQYQFELFTKLVSQGESVVVVDSNILLENPRTVLTNLCSTCGIAFEDNMLTWQAGPKPYDGVWAKYWYENVHASSGFSKQTTSTRPLPEKLVPLYEEALIYYEKLLPFSLKA